MRDLVADFGYVTAAVAGFWLLGAMLFAMEASLRGEIERAASLRRVARLAAGVTLIGMGLSIAVASPPISLSWGTLTVLFGAYFVRAAIRRPRV